jgi:hypothetical protein
MAEGEGGRVMTTIVAGDAGHQPVTPGDLRLIDSTLDGGQEALRIRGSDGAILVRGQVETDGKTIVRALRDWVTRALDRGTPKADASLPGEPIEPDGEGFVRMNAGAGPGPERLDSDIEITREGDVFVKGQFVEHDDKLRRNLRRLLARAQGSNGK